jgi:hypothetical protein
LIATTHSLTSATPKRPSAVASYGHTLGLVGIAIAVAALGALAQARPTTGGSLTSTPASALPAYVSALVMEALLVCYVWAGVRKRGVTLAALSGGRWSSLREVMRDIAIAIPFWIVWQAAADLADAVIGPSNAKSIDVLFPIGWLEVGAWIMVSVTAGIVEELVFRGASARSTLGAHIDRGPRPGGRVRVDARLSGPEGRERDLLSRRTVRRGCRVAPLDAARHDRAHDGRHLGRLTEGRAALPLLTRLSALAPQPKMRLMRQYRHQEKCLARHRPRSVRDSDIGKAPMAMNVSSEHGLRKAVSLAIRPGPGGCES